MKSTLLVFVLIFALLPAQNTEAKIFKNAYINFEMQDNWDCRLEQTEWVCRSIDTAEGKEAVIVLAAKEKGPADELSIYQNHMDNPVQSVSKSGTTLNSIVKIKSRSIKINDHTWLDSLHSDSEIQNYFTRYIATVKDNIAILVSFSAHNKFYAKHSPNFDKTIQSFKIVATQDFLKSIDTGKGSLGEFAGMNSEGGILMGAESDSASAGGGLLANLMRDEVLLWGGGALLLLAIALYVGLKVYQKNK
jgi:hypothetical protein